MSNEQKPAPSKQGERSPIRIEKLIITHASPNGVRLPDGVEGKSDKMQYNVHAGEHSDVRTDIEYRPWMRAFRVTRSKKVTRTLGDKEVASWVPMGKPFFVPETWAVYVPMEEL